MFKILLALIATSTPSYSFENGVFKCKTNFLIQINNQNIEKQSFSIDPDQKQILSVYDGKHLVAKIYPFLKPHIKQVIKKGKYTAQSNRDLISIFYRKNGNLKELICKTVL